MGKFALFALIVVSALWGSHPVVGKVVENQLSPFSLTVWRFTFCAICYLPFSKRFHAIFKLPRRLFWQLAFSGLCWAVLYPILYYSSLRTIAPTQSLLLVNTSPLLAALFAWAVLRERLNRYEWGGIALSFAGVLLLVVSEWGGSTSWTGAGLALLAAVAFAGYTVSSRALFQTLPLLDVLMGTSVWGAVLLWIVALARGDASHVVHEAAMLSGQGWMQLVYIVLIVSTLAYALYGYGLKRLPAGVSSAVTFYPQVLFAALIEWVWIGLVPSVVTAVSAVCILAGTALMQRKKPAAVKPASELARLSAEE